MVSKCRNGTTQNYCPVCGENISLGKLVLDLKFKSKTLIPSKRLVYNKKLEDWEWKQYLRRESKGKAMLIHVECYEQFINDLIEFRDTQLDKVKAEVVASEL